MTKFSIQHSDDRPDRVFVSIDNRFDVAVIRSEDGIRIAVIPITDGEAWAATVVRFEVYESDIRDLEAGHD